MTRVLVVAVVVAVVVAMAVLHQRRSRAVADRSGVVHPPLPERLRGPGRTWVVFATEYCAPCGPLLDRIRLLQPAETVHKVMVEDDPALASAFSIRSAPTLIVADGSGEVVHSIVGASASFAYVESVASVST